MPTCTLAKGENTPRLQVPRSVVLLVGDYGSGKTEVAVNLTLEYVRLAKPRSVAIADLDLVNPYFRCREAQEPLREAGVRVVVPEGGHQYADLPILLPAVRGIVEDPQTLSVLDVGGDSVGSRVLAALAPPLEAAGSELWLVVNKMRPFNDTVEGCQKTVARIEAASGLAVTGLVANTHLMQETTPAMVQEGVALAEGLAKALEVPVALVAAMESVARELPREDIPYPLLCMQRLMLPPWIVRSEDKVGPETFGLGSA